MRLVRILASIFGVLLFLILLPLSVVAGLVWATLPPDGGEVRIPGLSAPVDVTFDQDGIPRIHAASQTDAAAALGYVHARDRMFQMELMRRAASGRLSELAGPATLRLDRLARIRGNAVHAAADLVALPADTRAMLDAYTSGVNAWIAQRGRFAAPEFLVLGAPEPWTAADCLLQAKTLEDWLSSNADVELSRLALSGRLSAADILQLWPADAPGGHPDALALDVRYAGLARRVLDALPGFPEPFTQPSEASNEWAVDGRHTVSGAPLLAGDPHLGLGFPGIWYLARIDTPDEVLAGATAPGAPFLVIGRNAHIAWTFTTTGADVQDVFEETVLPDGTYQTPDGPRPFTTRVERIRVRGAPDDVLTVRESRHGPVISDAAPNARPPAGTPPGTVLALAATELAPDDTAAAGLLALNRATTVEEAGRAAAQISAPVQNLLVADHSRIALFTTGRVPVRRAGDGAAPVAGADGAHDWLRSVGGFDLPYVVAPESGRLVNANERTAPPDFPVYLGRDFFGDWRAQRIRQLLEASGKLTAADMARMQVDTVSDYARQLLPTLLAVKLPDGPAHQAAALLQHWDGDMAMDLPQPLIFNAWLDRFYLDVLHRAGIEATRAAPRLEFTAFLLTPAGAHWCGGDCTPMLADALVRVVASLSRRLGDDPAAWRWGDVHQAVFAHPILGRMPVLGPLTTARIAQPGDSSTIFVGDSGVGSFTSLHGPGYRGVYDLANLDQSLFVVVPGQSGNPVSPHARDFLQRWRDGGTVTLGPDPVRTEARLRMVP
jgi:penicillin amidase